MEPVKREVKIMKVPSMRVSKEGIAAVAVVVLLAFLSRRVHLTQDAAAGIRCIAHRHRRDEDNA